MHTREILTPQIFRHILEFEVKRALRYQNYFCLITLKMSGFSDGNQRFPACYMKLIHCLMEEIRESDVLASLDDSNTVVLLPYTDTSGGSYILERFQSKINCFDFEKEGYEVKATQVCFPTDGVDPQDLIRRLSS